MDKRNKNIEDFFNKSLEQFSDAPSDKVWMGIANQLATDKLPFYKRWKFWTTTFMAIAILSLLTYSYFSTQKAIDLLMLKTNQLEQENQTLNLALKECSVAAETAFLEKEQQNAIENLEIRKPAKLIKKTNTPLAKVDKLISSSFFMPTFFKPIASSSFSDFGGDRNLLFRPAGESFQRMPLTNSLPVWGWFFPTDNERGMDDAKTRDLEEIHSVDNLEMPISEEAITAIKESGFHHLAKLDNRQLGARRVKTSFRRNLPNTFIDYAPLHLTQPLSQKLDYKFGFGFGGMSTFTDKKDLFGPGYNIGLTNELQFFKNVYLTAGIHYNEQRYEIKLNANNQDILQSYPAVEELTNVVTSINQHAHYLELPIGLKWYFKENPKKTKFYVNPSVAWHFYFPQQFEYEQATNNGIRVKGYRNNQYFGYFGTAQLQVGLERPLFKKMHYQVGLWAEKSLIPLGVENRDLFNIGFRGAVFFD